MKKHFALIITLLAVAVLVTGCSSINQPDPAASTVSEFIEKVDSAMNTGEATVSENSKNNGEAEKESSSKFNAQAIADKIKAKGYTCSNGYSYELALVLSNTSDSDCKINVSVDFYDKNDKIVDTQESDIDVFSAGTENALDFYCVDEFSTYKYEIKVSEHEDYLFSVNDKLSCDVSIATDKAIISATNNGNETAEYVRYTALFFKGDNFVYVNCGSLGDDECEIKPGATEKETASCYEDFDSVKVYLDGRGSKY